MDLGENTPLVRRSSNLRSGVIHHPKKKCSTKLKVVILLLVAILIVIAAVVASQGFGSSSVKWTQIEHIDLQFVPEVWKWDGEVDPNQPITLTLAVKQQNRDELDKHLLSVSDPKSSNYGNHLTYEEVHDLFKPSEESLDAVHRWLRRSNIHDEDISRITPNGDFIEVKTTIGNANRMLNTKFGYWKHDEKDLSHVRVKEHYYVPHHVRNHLDFISPTLRFPLSPHIKLKEEIGTYSSINELMDNINSDTTYTYVLPSSLKSLYKVNEVKGGNADTNYQAVASFMQEWYNDDDLSQFWDFFSLSESSMTRIPSMQPEGYGSEAELDVQYITAMGEGINTYVWDIEDDLYFISLLAQIASEKYTTPSVVSMSYGGDEPSVGFAYSMRANVEFGKIGLMGITFLASSGDAGALSSSDTCTSDNEFVATFPASSPYVTTIGGVTGGLNSDSTVDSDSSESAWTYSGGGFSTFFSQQTFQTDAISYFLENSEVLPDSSRYNSDGAGYPDLAAQSEYFVICAYSSYWAMSGTSASCPTVAGMIALINDARIAAGKSALGWLNPAIYGLYNDGAQSTYFNDVTEGYNLGCDIDDYVGYHATTGWDAVTGLGSLQFDQLYDYLVSL